MTILLKDLLLRYTVPDLKELAEHLRGAKSTGRKDELVARIFEAFAGDGLEQCFLSLDETQQLAVAEAVHDPQGVYSALRFQAKYGKLPIFEISGKKSGIYGTKPRSALCLFIHPVPEFSSQCVPSDLRERLLAFVPKPPPVALPGREELPEVEGRHVRLSEREAAQELQLMLRTIEQGRIQVGEKTAIPSTAAQRLLTEKLVGGDFYPWVEKQDKWDQQVGPIRAFAWPLLLQAGGLAQRNGSRLCLSPQGIKALAAQPADVLRSLWRKWLKTTSFDEFSRVDEIKGQGGKGRVMTAVAMRRAVIEDALRVCPVGRWISIESFSRFMRAEDFLFNVTHDPWRLYLCEREYGSLGYAGNHEWNILEERYLLALLFEYAATLGMIDVAYTDPKGARKDFRGLWGADELYFLSRYDGLCDFRITALGAYILGVEERYQPAAIKSQVRLSVLPSLRVNVTGGTLAAEASLLLGNWAVEDSPGCWRLDKEKSVTAVARGFKIGELKNFLTEGDDMPLPDTVESFLRQCERNGKALKLIGNALLIECRDSETADTIANHPETATLCQRAGNKSLVVRADLLEKFRERVLVLGFGMTG